MTDLEFKPAEEFIDRVLGKKGTPERDKIEAQIKAEAEAYYLGEAIKEARLQQNLTQEQLGEKAGIKKSQIDRMEKGKSVMTLPTMSRVFRALGFSTASLDLGRGHRIALWS